jgi:hypothetical protein
MSDDAPWLLDSTAVEEYTAKASPGRCLRSHGRLWPLAEDTKDDGGTNESVNQQSLTPKERRHLRKLYQKWHNMKQLSAKGTGYDSVSKVQTTNKKIERGDRIQDRISKKGKLPTTELFAFCSLRTADDATVSKQVRQYRFVKNDDGSVTEIPAQKENLKRQCPNRQAFSPIKRAASGVFG